MRFLHIKNEQICKHCGSTLTYGEEAVVLRLWIKGFLKPTFFHLDCFLIWNSEVFLYRLNSWRQSINPRPERKRIPKKLGRPIKYLNSSLAHKLLMKKAYHLKIGHMEEVSKIQEEIDKLEKKN